MGTYAVTASMMFSRTNVEAGVPSMVLTGDVGDAFHDNIQEIGTSYEAVGLGAAGAGGWCYLQNLDETNFVEVAKKMGDEPFTQLAPGKFAMFPLHPGAVPVAQADTAACEMRVLLFEPAP